MHMEAKNIATINIKVVLFLFFLGNNLQNRNATKLYWFGNKNKPCCCFVFFNSVHTMTTGPSIC